MQGIIQIKNLTKQYGKKPVLKNLNLEKTGSKETLIPYSAIIAIGDFVIVSEEDLI